jgi:hypothetical protein
MNIDISRLRYVPADPFERRNGLFGYLSLDVNDALRLDGITVRRTRDGRLTLSYPVRTNERGVEFFVVRPIRDDVRLAIEHRVFEDLGLVSDA